MINSINGTNIPKINPFGTVTDRNSIADYWLGENTEPKSAKQTDALGSILPETIILNPEEARKTNNLKIIGISIASATILAAAGIFIVLRGGPKGIAKGIQTLRDFLERKVQKSKLSGAKASGYEYLLGKADYLLGKAQAVNNFTTIKDLDTQLVDLRKTTTMSASDLNEFYLEANNVAKQMGVTTSEIISQASAWSRLNKIGPLYGNV